MAENKIDNPDTEVAEQVHETQPKTAPNPSSQSKGGILA